MLESITLASTTRDYKDIETGETAEDYIREPVHGGRQVPDRGGSDDQWDSGRDPWEIIERWFRR